MADILKLAPLREVQNACYVKTNEVFTELHKRMGRDAAMRSPEYLAACETERIASAAFHREWRAVQQCSPANLTHDGFVRPTYREYCATRRAYGFSVDTFELWCNWQRFNGNFNPIEG